MRIITVLAALSFTAVPAMAEAWDFVLINDTSKPIKAIEVAVTGTGEWKANIKEEGVADKGPVKVKARTTVHLDKPSDKCRFDIKATFADDTAQVWSNANICDNSYITVKLVGDKATISAN